MNLNQLTRFSDKARDCHQYRPRYPSKIRDILWEEKVLLTNSVIADIGSGTGILSELFLNAGYKVFAVEPNEDMRQHSEKLHDHLSNFVSIDGTAEETTLLSDSIDLIIVGQAFHWFNSERTLQEFRRILKQDGFLMLIWNRKTDYDNETKADKAYNEFAREYSEEYDTVRALRKTLDYDSIFTNFKHIQIPNPYHVDFSRYLGMIKSSSYFKKPFSEQMIRELKTIFDMESRGEMITMDITSALYFGKI